MIQSQEPSAIFESLAPEKPGMVDRGARLLRRAFRAPRSVFSIVRGKCAALLFNNPNVVDFLYRYSPFKQRRPMVTPMGFKMAGGNSVHHRSMMNGDFEKVEARAILALVDEADVFVDVGANIGYYALMARQKNKHVIAVEPQSANFQFLCENFVANGWEDAEVYPMGLGKRPGIARLYGLSSTGASMLPGWAGATQAWRQTIPVTTLDGVLSGRFLEKNVLIKIDVEGVEYDVLQGARAALVRSPQPTFIIEICLGEFDPRGRNPNFRDTFRLFWQNGYEAFQMDGDKRPVTAEDVERWVRFGRTDSGVINYLFVPRRAA
jgi:FkbM family methyltransferase